MNKSELILAMSEKTGLTKKDSDAAIKAFFEIIAEELKKGEKVQLVGIGTFEVSERSAREGRNPLTNEKIQIPSKVNPRLKFGKPFKEQFN